MNKLEVVKCRNGIFQDVHGRPMAIVFDTREKAGREQIKVLSEVERTFEDSQPFLFANATASAEKDAIVERMVRSHVRRKHKRGPRVLLRGSRLRDPATRNPLGNDSSHMFLSSSHSPPPPAQPGRSFDPFLCYPVPMQPYMHRLLHNYLTFLVHVWFPRTDPRQHPAQSSLFELAMADAALFHAILCSSSLYLDIASGNCESFQSILHKMEAIRLINAQLNDISKLSDTTIGAVASLAIVEFVLGNSEAWDLHRNGLSKMLELRGGWESLCLSLRGKVCMADLFGCLEFDLPPQLPFFDTTPSELSPCPPHQELNEGFQNVSRIINFGSNLIHIFQDVQHLTYLFIELSAPPTFTDRRTLDHLAHSLRHRLLSYPSARITTTPDDTIRESLRLVALIYIKLILPGYPSRDRIYQTLVKKLKYCIDSINLSGLASNRVVGELVLWLLFVGGTVELGDAHRAWSMLRISKTAEAMQFKEWSEVKATLRKFLFVEDLHDRLFSVLWSELMMANNCR